MVKVLRSLRLQRPVLGFLVLNLIAAGSLLTPSMANAETASENEVATEAANDAASEAKETPSLTLTGRINASSIKEATSLNSSAQASQKEKHTASNSKGKIYLPCKVRRGKSGYLHIELATAGGSDWSQVVNHKEIPALKRDMLHVKN